MARVRSPNRDKAFEIYKEHNGKIANREIAKILDVSEKTISGWKVKDKWNKEVNGVLQKEIRSTPKELSAIDSLETSKEVKPSWNKNEYPTMKRLKNKNAIVTGEHENIFSDCLEEDELKLINRIKIEKRSLLEQEIQLLTVRERRMLKRIDALKDREEVILDSETHGTQGDGEISVSNYDSALNVIQRIEDALTRVQDKKQKAIDTLHKFEMDEHKLELTVMKLELDIMKQGGQDEEVEDDGFVDALKSGVGDTWDD